VFWTYLLVFFLFITNLYCGISLLEQSYSHYLAWGINILIFNWISIMSVDYPSTVSFAPSSNSNSGFMSLSCLEWWQVDMADYTLVFKCILSLICLRMPFKVFNHSYFVLINWGKDSFTISQNSSVFFSICATQVALATQMLSFLYNRTQII
jgi:hypothetical protein